MPSLQKTIANLPDSPGIYLFYDNQGELMYVGKATSLKQRVRSYFSGKRSARPIEQMVDSIEKIKVKETESVLEAIIAEANAIKSYLPKYNVDGKDNKSWNYIVFTREAYPKVQTYREHQMKQLSDTQKKERFSAIFGPFPGLNAKATLKILRQLFFYSNCTPASEQKRTARPCLYYQMGQCLGVCTGEITASEYNKQVMQPLRMFLKGGKKRLLGSIKKRMQAASKRHDYEQAARLRDQLERLKHIHDVTLINQTFFEDSISSNERIRIEGYDISNLGASDKVGSMVVSNGSGPIPSEYRKFIIRSVKGQSDVDCLEEVLRRRLRHDEWPLPTLFLIDGGVPQVNRVKTVLQDYGLSIPIVGIAKGPTRKKNEFILGSKNKQLVQFVKNQEQLLVQTRDEAHRFAINFQRQRRKLKRS